MDKLKFDCTELEYVFGLRKRPLTDFSDIDLSTLPHCSRPDAKIVGDLAMAGVHYDENKEF